MKPFPGLLAIFFLVCNTTLTASSTYYISSSEGADSYSGLTPSLPWKTLSKVNRQDLLPGDSVLFKAGDTFIGRISIVDMSGSPELPIFIGSYGDGSRPLIDGDGYLAAIQIKNSGYIHIHNLEITNERAHSRVGVSEDLRYGIYLENSYSDGRTFDHYRFDQLSFRDIYPTTQLSDDDQAGVNAHAITTTGSWGDNIHPRRFRDMLIENCYFTGIGRHALVLKAVEGLKLRHNHFFHVGGAGIVIGAKCKNVTVEKNITDHTGSSIDPRMAGRGSGCWCWGSENVVVQYNKFMYARGIKDSYGMHIDHSNRNVLYQYNYSEGNEGGFVEILGNNVNVGYRYNLSIGDGWRKRGPTHGQIYWLTGWSGDPNNPEASDSIFIYNNSVYIPDTIQPGILIKKGTNCRIHNNIICASNGFGDVIIETDPENIDFNYNLWHGSIPVFDTDGRVYRGSNAVTGDPRFRDPIVRDSAGFMLQNDSPGINAGLLIRDSHVDHPFDYYVNHGGVDYYGNPVSDTTEPNMGAWDGKEATGLSHDDTGANPSISLYPNPLWQNDHLTISITCQTNYQSAYVSLFDSNGRIILNREFRADRELIIPAGSVSMGYYIVRVQAGDLLNSMRLVVM